MARRTRLWVISALVVAGVTSVIVVELVDRQRESRAGTPAHFIGSANCATCHAPEYAAWKTSQHAAAMQDARGSAVLGQFDGTRFTNAGVTSTFFRRGDRFVVNTDGPDGRTRDFEVRYTFGVYPLQQYLVELPGGRVQALTIAWDARPAALGGRRWFTLYPGMLVAHTDEFHWTGRQNNWNFMCADCHSTGVRKGYDAATDQFRTTRAEISVGCEACHGPGSRHARWASYPSLLRRLAWADDGLPARLTERRGVQWSMDSGASIAHRSAPRRSDREIETCAQCHASRAHIAEGYTAGAPLLDYYIPSLILPDLYFADGQQRDEVYDYGSFLQSRMYRGGVTCADCHDPHTQKLRATGNEVCAQCHRPSTYDTSAHHFHTATSAGARCVSCHMPDTTYMEIDPRHDHSIRVPRPDRSVSLGLPNACNRCHGTRDAQWADSAVRAWYGRVPVGFQVFAGAFAADDRGDPGAADSLAAVFGDSAEPVIVRASALARLARYRGRLAFEAAQAGADDDQALVRLASLQVLEAFPPRERIMTGVPLLGDPTRAVRQGAAWVIAPMADSLRTPLQRRAFAAAAEEFVASQRYNADRAGNRLALAAFYAQRGRLDSATVEYEAALRIAPRFREARLGLAAVLSARGRRADALRGLDSARAWYPQDRDVLLALAILSRDAGDTAAARRYARSLVRAHPGDAQGRALIDSLGPEP
jgi:predicted CXXCH cytochrome family protein